MLYLLSEINSVRSTRNFPFVFNRLVLGTNGMEHLKGKGKISVACLAFLPKGKNDHLIAG